MPHARHRVWQFTLPDGFSLDLWHQNPSMMTDVWEEQAAQLHNPPVTARQVVEGMHSLVPKFAQEVLSSGLLGHDHGTGEGHLLEEISPGLKSSISG
jgi:hypothetical protein